MNFDLDVFTLKKLITEVDLTLTFFLEVESANFIPLLWSSPKEKRLTMRPN